MLWAALAVRRHPPSEAIRTLDRRSGPSGRGPTLIVRHRTSQNDVKTDKELTHRDEIHGDVQYDPLAVALLDTASLQRLGRVYQLGYGHLVYRGGNHTRLSHCMGAYATAGRLVGALQQNYARQGARPRGAIPPDEFLPRAPEGPVRDPAPLMLDLDVADAATEVDRWTVLLHIVRWAGLVHDVGHVPLGHTLEDEFTGIYAKHDSFVSPRLRAFWVADAAGAPAEIRTVLGCADLYPPAFGRLGITGEDVWGAVLLLCTWKEEIEDGVRTPFNDLLERHIRHASDRGTAPGLAPELLDLDARLSGTLFAPYMADIVANTISADYLDYLRRDPHNLGLDVLKDDRVVSRFWIGRDHLEQPRMALSLVDRRGKRRLDTCTGVVELVRQRYRFAEIVYYHKTKVAASAMLAKVFDLVGAPPDAPARREVPHLSDVDALTDEVLAAESPARDRLMTELRQRLMPTSIADVEIGDDSLHLMLRDAAWEKLDAAARSGAREEARVALQAIVLLDAITHRHLHKVAFAMGPDDFQAITGKHGNERERALAELIQGLRGSANARAEAEAAMVAASNSCPEHSLLLYVPPRKSQAKGIETGALADHGTVTTLEEHPAVSAEVESLNDHYRALWRLLVLVHPDYAGDAVSLSAAVDALVERRMPYVDLDDHKVIAALRECAWVRYLPRRERGAALRFCELRDGGPDDVPWEMLEEFERRQDGRGSEHELACGAALAERLVARGGPAALERLAAYAQPGSLEARVKEAREAVLVSASRRGDHDVDAATRALFAALDRLADDLLR
jgi:HD superfamily phosphohydrolase